MIKMGIPNICTINITPFLRLGGKPSSHALSFLHNLQYIIFLFIIQYSYETVI